MSLDLTSLRNQCTDSYSLVFSEDGTSLFLREWTSSTTSSTAIVILHGITAHSKIYGDIGQELASLGYQVFGFDLRGHGLSGGNRGDFSSKEKMYDDFNAVVDYVKEEYDTMLLMGHSMGVTTALQIIERKSEEIDGLIFLSGRIKIPIKLIPNYSFLEKLKIGFFTKFLPSKQVITIDLLDELVETDDLFVFNYTRRFFEIMEIGRYDLPEELDQPVLALIGDKDELVEVGEMEEFFSSLPAEDKEFVVIKNAKHVEFPENMIEKAGIANWLDRKFPLDEN